MTAVDPMMSLAFLGCLVAVDLSLPWRPRLRARRTLPMNSGQVILASLLLVECVVMLSFGNLIVAFASSMVGLCYIASLKRWTFSMLHSLFNAPASGTRAH